MSLEADLSDTDAPGEVFDFVQQRLGPVSALVLAHCESVDSNIIDTTIEAFDRLSQNEPGGMGAHPTCCA
ncbi:MAG: hypothetical protein WD250_10000, partial [Egibacteraceae bacterium]